MTGPNNRDILNLLKEKSIEKRLAITPIIFPEQINNSSVDLRLGSEFYVFTQHNIASFDPINNKDEINHER